MNKGEFRLELQKILVPWRPLLEKAAFVGSVAKIADSVELKKGRDIDIVVFIKSSGIRLNLLMAFAELSKRAGYLLHPIVVDESNAEHFEHGLLHRKLLDSAEYFNV